MRISDWSSDVCSSDLATSGRGIGGISAYGGSGKVARPCIWVRTVQWRRGERIDLTRRRDMKAGHRKRALVAGGAGFLGSHLCDRLVADGMDVVCLDNFLTGRRDNLAKLEHVPGFDVVETDVVDPQIGRATV